MASLDLFWGFVDYHCNANLEECLGYIREGTLHSDKDKGPQITEGSDVRVPYEGIVVLKNGSTLINKLVDDGSIRRSDVSKPVYVGDRERLHDFLHERDEEDGAYVFESASNTVRRVGMIRLGKATDSERDGYDGKVPLNFLVDNVTDDPKLGKLGTKTRLAIELSQDYQDIHAFQIKRSGYGELRMGKVTHFDKDGLVEEFFMDSVKHSGEYCVFEQEVKPGLTIYGYYRRYRTADNTPNRDAQGNLIRIPPPQINPGSIPEVKPKAGIEQYVSNPA